MNLLFQFFILVGVGTFIGWLTNKLAVWLLFNPKEPISFLGLKFQGVFPKRQKEIALSIADIVTKELLSYQDLKERIFTEEHLEWLNYKVESRVTDYLENDFKKDYPWINLMISQNRKLKVTNQLLKKLNQEIKYIENDFVTTLENKLDLEALIVEKITAFDPNQMNDLMNKMLKNELQFIEIVGAIVGFFIGLIQFLLLIFMS